MLKIVTFIASVFIIFYLLQIFMVIMDLHSRNYADKEDFYGDLIPGGRLWKSFYSWISKLIRNYEELE